MSGPPRTAWEITAPIHRLAEAGLDGIECNHPSHSASDRTVEWKSLLKMRISVPDRRKRLSTADMQRIRRVSLGQYPRAPESSRIIFEQQVMPAYSRKKQEKYINVINVEFR